MRFKKQCALALGFASYTTNATPWVDTNDNYLRQSLQTLSHAGLLSGPINTYPLMWKNIAADLHQVNAQNHSKEVEFALAHVRHVLYINQDDKTSGFKLKGNSEVAGIQSFGETYTETLSATVFKEFQTQFLAGRLEVSYRNLHQGQTEQKTIYDNSYLAALLGNWTLSFDQMSNWWGPGQQSTLLLSNNARPFPALRLSRHGWEASDLPVLKWLGPWTFTTYIGKGEHQSPVPNTRFWGTRFNLRPTKTLELGFSRVSQWGGDGKDNSALDWWNMVWNNEGAKDNTDQRAALDISYHLQTNLPLTVYGEIADDDNAKGLPNNPLLLLGVRSYWGNSEGIHTVNLEYSDTYIDCEDSLVQGDCAYQGELYPQGYTRYGRVIGSGYGKDARVVSAGYHYQTFDGISWSFHLYQANDYNLGDRSSALQLKAEHRRPLFEGLLSLQVRYLESSPLLVEGGSHAAIAATWEYRL